MTILDRLLGHDAWTTRQLLLRCRELTDEQMDRSFDIGDRSLQQTFEHIVACMESHTDLLRCAATIDPRRNETSVEGLLVRLKLVAKDFGEIASRVDRDGTADDMCTRPDSPGKWPLGSVISHILTHSMHHRAQAMYILEQLGITDILEGDALGWEGQARGWGYNWSRSYGKVVAE